MDYATSYKCGIYTKSGRIHGVIMHDVSIHNYSWFMFNWNTYLQKHLIFFILLIIAWTILVYQKKIPISVYWKCMIIIILSSGNIVRLHLGEGGGVISLCFKFML